MESVTRIVGGWGVALALGLALAGACAPRTEIGEVEASGGDAAGTSAAGTSAAGKAGGGDTNVGGTTAGSAGNAALAGEGGRNAEAGAGGQTQEGGAGGAVDCSAFDDGATNSVKVKIRNATAAPIFVVGGTSCSEPRYVGVTDDKGEKLGGPTQCRTPCSQVALQGTIEFCEPLCGNPTLTQLDPGASMTTSWDGRDLVEAMLPKACQLDAQDPSYGEPQFCRVWQTQKPGTYEFKAKAGTSANCGQGATGVTQLPNCQATGEGACEQESCDPAGSSLEATASLELTADLSSPSVELVFEP